MCAYSFTKYPIVRLTFQELCDADDGSSEIQIAEPGFAATRARWHANRFYDYVQWGSVESRQQQMNVNAPSHDTPQ